MKSALLGLVPVVLLLSGVTAFGLASPDSLTLTLPSGGPDEFVPFAILVSLGGLQVVWAVFIVRSR